MLGEYNKERTTITKHKEGQNTSTSHEKEKFININEMIRKKPGSFLIKTAGNKQVEFIDTIMQGKSEPTIELPILFDKPDYLEKALIDNEQQIQQDIKKILDNK